ncbi:MAG TPA: hypothetical protein VJ801_10530 [Polyangia bacterium]|jgi:hypothetical protein|nr:hypothetical protein [Polyangia bacterium]
MLGAPTKFVIPIAEESRPRPSIAAAADGYGVLWGETEPHSDMRKLIFVKLDPAAARVGERRQVLKLPERAPWSALVSTERGFAFAFGAASSDDPRQPFAVALALLDPEGKLLREQPVGNWEGAAGEVALAFVRGSFVVVREDHVLSGPARDEIRSMRLDADGRSLAPAQTVATVRGPIGLDELVVGRYNDSDSVAYHALRMLDARTGAYGWHLVDLARPGEEEESVPDSPDLVWTPERGVVATSKSLAGFLRLASIRNRLAVKDGRGLVAWTHPETDIIQVAPVCGL